MRGLWKWTVVPGMIANALGAGVLAAQGSSGRAGPAIDVCTLATDEEFQRAQGLHPQLGVLPADPPVLTMMTWGPHCDYGPGSIDLITHQSPKAELDRILKLMEGGKNRVPVAGLGKPAFFTTIYPDDKYRNRGLIAIDLGPRMLLVSMDARDTETTEATRPKLEPFAKLVLSRYK